MNRPTAFDDIGYLATEALAEVGLGEDDAEAMTGFDVIRDLRVRVALRCTEAMDPADWPAAELRRLIVRETLAYVGHADRADAIYDAIYIGWRNRRFPVERTTFRDLEDKTLWATPAVREAA